MDNLKYVQTTEKALLKLSARAQRVVRFSQDFPHLMSASIQPTHFICLVIFCESE